MQECRLFLPPHRVYKPIKKHHPHPHAKPKVLAPGQVTPDREFTSESPQNKHAQAWRQLPFLGPSAVQGEP